MTIDQLIKLVLIALASVEALPGSAGAKVNINLTLTTLLDDLKEKQAESNQAFKNSNIYFSLEGDDNVYMKPKDLSLEEFLKSKAVFMERIQTALIDD
jgi:hypothetical protein